MSKQFPMKSYRDGREYESLRIKDFSSLITLALLGTTHKFLMLKNKNNKHQRGNITLGIGSPSFCFSRSEFWDQDEFVYLIFNASSLHIP